MTKMDDTIIGFITEYYRKNLFYPNYDEIAKSINRTKSTVYTHMKRMEDEGVIIRKDNYSPQYRLINMNFILNAEEVLK